MVKFKFFLTVFNMNSCRIFRAPSSSLPFLLRFKQLNTTSATFLPVLVFVCLSKTVYILSKTLSKKFCFTLMQTQSIEKSWLQWSFSYTQSLSSAHLGQSVHSFLTSTVSVHWWHLIHLILNSAIFFSTSLISSLIDCSLFLHFSTHLSQVCLRNSISTLRASLWNDKILVLFFV